jgi:hypothetical protein
MGDFLSCSGFGMVGALGRHAQSRWPPCADRP